MNQDFTDIKILLGITGGIAAYKSAYLVRELTRLGADVRVVMTTSALQFITPMTMQALSGHEVRSELFDPQAERAMGHIELARWADLILIAPCSANTMAKMAHGIADDLLSTIYLVAETPVIVCPAMNRSMWAHSATVDNRDTLIKRGVVVVGPAAGSQACGEEGLGRMSEVDTIIDALRLYKTNQLLAGKKILITAGPTREEIDPVRFISNRSSGKMGYALAKAAQVAGAEVTLVSGPTNLLPPEIVTFEGVVTATEMLDAVNKHLNSGVIFIATAAVADYGVQNPAEHKLKKQQAATLNLKFTHNPDILASVAASGKAAYVVGFAAETKDLIKHARKKLANKKLDMIIANDVSNGAVFDNDNNQVTILTQTEQIELPKQHKTTLAGEIIKIIAKMS